MRGVCFLKLKQQNERIVDDDNDNNSEQRENWEMKMSRAKYVTFLFFCHGTEQKVKKRA